MLKHRIALVSLVSGTSVLKNNEGVCIMEKKTMGSFMAALRKANGLTQQQVADRLNVSNKTISKWECDDGYPEITMLPVIAELYGVSVDELLCGERLVRSTENENTNSKSERNARYLVDKAVTRFGNSSIVSIILGVIAAVSAYIIHEVTYSQDLIRFGYIVVLLLGGASLAVASIALNNFISGIQNQDVVDKGIIEANTKRCVKKFSAVVCLSVIALLRVLIQIIGENELPKDLLLPVSAVVGVAIAFLTYSMLLKGLFKKLEIKESELSPQQVIYRKKHIKITAVISAAVLVISAALPFIIALADGARRNVYSFTDDMYFQGCEFETIEEAATEYYKLRDFVKGERKVYEFFGEDYEKSDDGYTVYVDAVSVVYEEDEKGYNFVESKPNKSVELHFKTIEELEQFIAEHSYDDVLLYSTRMKNMTFNDEAFSVSYQKTDVLSGVGDIEGLFVIIGSCISIIVLIASYALYRKKKETIE